ncbi:hypothetical protein FQN52_004226 [Onygenales sp. PD_12]|nr:hypothetical protein FQN52_004226 [Onygenales sp. PD_12]
MAVLDPGFTPFRRDNLLAARDVRTTFSSWDNCMTKAYCKWPAIVGIIVGSLVLIAVAWCIIGCLCCGYTCCKGCCSCCCPSSSGRKPRSAYADEHNAYSTQNRHLSTGYQPPPGPPIYESQQKKYAQFDTPSHRGKPLHEDSLPAMPVWDNAPTRRVEDHSPISPAHDLEMNRLDPATGQNLGRTARGGYYEIPSNSHSPQYPPAEGGGGYRGTETTNHYPAAAAAAGGINRTPSPGLAYSHSPGIARTQSPAYAYSDNTMNPTTNRPISALYPTAITTSDPSPPTYGNGTDMGIGMGMATAPAPVALRQFTRSPIGPSSPSSPSHSQRSYSPYPPQQQPQLQQPQQQQQYTAYSPTTPSSPPPPFSSTLGDYDQVLPGAAHGQGPPGALQVGRKNDGGW